jgi:hypothetical protein
LKSSTSISHGSGAVDGDALVRRGIVVVHTVHGRKNCELTIAKMPEDTAFVHVNGTPFLWMFEAVLSRCSSLKTIQVIPSAFPGLLGKGGHFLCQARGVDIVAGHVRPEAAWEAGRIVSPQYAAQRRFLQTMSGEQRALFDELLALGFEQATMVARYFCLAEEDYIPQRLLATEYGYANGHSAIVSSILLSVLWYLDDTMKVGEDSMRRGRSIRRHVLRLRPMLASAERRVQLAEDLGVPRFALTLPIARLDVFAALVRLYRDGRMASLLLHREYEMLVLRFGLDDLQAPVYRTLLEVGERLDNLRGDGGVTRERARQLEESALSKLGIVDD